MKTLRAIAFISVADGLLVLAALLLVAGYQWQAAALGVGTLAAVALVAWLCRSKPEPQPEQTDWFAEDEDIEYGASGVEYRSVRPLFGDPVITHADLARRRGEPGWPEQHLLQPRRPGAHRL